MTRGALLLTNFLKARRLRRSECAALIGVSKPLVSMWLGTKRRPPANKPNLDHRRKIREATGGRVPMSSWDEQAQQAPSVSNADNRKGPDGRRAA